MFKKFIYVSLITSFSFSNDYSPDFDGQDDYAEINNQDFYSNLNQMSINLYLKFVDIFLLGIRWAPTMRFTT